MRACGHSRAFAASPAHCRYSWAFAQQVDEAILSRTPYRVSVARSSLFVMPCAILMLVHSPPAGADAMMQINQLCSGRWPDNATAQLICAKSQAVSAKTLIKRIETAAEGSPEFNVAKACIEKFKITPPSTIDWGSALNCFKSRVGVPVGADDSAAP